MDKKIEVVNEFDNCKGWKLRKHLAEKYGTLYSKVHSVRPPIQLLNSEMEKFTSIIDDIENIDNILPVLEYYLTMPEYKERMHCMDDLIRDLVLIIGKLQQSLQTPIF